MFKFNIKEKLENYKRVLIIARKPDREEFSRTAKICALGIAIIGIVGLIFYLISVFFIG